MFKIQHTDLNVAKKVNAIKALRQMTGLGLKQAKDAIDAVYMSPRAFVVFEPAPIGDTLEAQERNMREGLEYFEGAGFTVTQQKAHFEFDPLRFGLTSLAHQAIDSEELDLAHTLIALAMQRKRKVKNDQPLRPGEFAINTDQVGLGDLIKKQMNESEQTRW